MPLLTAFVVVVGMLPTQTAAPMIRAAETITGRDVARHVNVIADDSMLGRDTPSRGLELTAQYVADQFQRFGLQPGGDNGTWLQRYPVPKGTGTAPNVVGIIEGSDAKLKHEYLVFSAHMDHVGVEPGQADSVYNGADDNASGTAGLIELAEAFSQPGIRPRRSLIFLGTSGEEKAFWGSRYFVAHPPVPLAQLVAAINIDMIGRNWVDTIVAVGKAQSDLGVTLARVNAAHPELRMLAIDDPWPQQRFFFRSDNGSFVRKGVPILWFFNGGHQDVHRVTDSPEQINAEKAARVLRLIFYFGHEVANADQRPKWNEASYREAISQP